MSLFSVHRPSKATAAFSQYPDKTMTDEMKE
jgi:hypothetical protein